MFWRSVSRLSTMNPFSASVANASRSASLNAGLSARLGLNAGLSARLGTGENPS